MCTFLIATPSTVCDISPSATPTHLTRCSHAASWNYPGGRFWLEVLVGNEAVIYFCFESILCVCLFVCFFIRLFVATSRQLIPFYVSYNIEGCVIQRYDALRNFLFKINQTESPTFLNNCFARHLNSRHSLSTGPVSSSSSLGPTASNKSLGPSSNNSSMAPTSRSSSDRTYNRSLGPPASNRSLGGSSTDRNPSRSIQEPSSSNRSLGPTSKIVTPGKRPGEVTKAAAQQMMSQAVSEIFRVRRWDG